jgi:hypothetical protein
MSTKLIGLALGILLPETGEPPGFLLLFVGLILEGEELTGRGFGCGAGWVLVGFGVVGVEGRGFGCGAGWVLVGFGVVGLEGRGFGCSAGWVLVGFGVVGVEGRGPLAVVLVGYWE